MNIAVRYCSKTKFGNTMRIAEAMADALGVKAVSIMDEPKLPEKVDVLFLGGAPYANIMAPELREYAESLTSDMVDKVVLFTTSNWSRRTVLALKKILRERNIEVEDEFFYAHMLNIENNINPAKEFALRKKKEISVNI
ncbi:MAG: hypothetical protein J6O60_04975 [Lachnospiraceae bacterium]|nr:hypothetical protein [Lachnospiraceae bacterium]